VHCLHRQRKKKNRNHVFEGERRSSKDFGSGTCLIFSFDNVGSERERDGQSNIVWYFVILYVTVESANKERERESQLFYI